MRVSSSQCSRNSLCFQKCDCECSTWHYSWAVTEYGHRFVKPKCVWSDSSQHSPVAQWGTLFSLQPFIYIQCLQTEPLIRRCNEIFPIQTFKQVIDVPATQSPLQSTGKEREVGKEKEMVCWRKTLKYAAVPLSSLLVWDASSFSSGAGAGKWKVWSLVTGWRNSNMQRDRSAASTCSGALRWRGNFKLKLIRGVKAPWHFQQVVNELRGTSHCYTLEDQCERIR